ncbi:natural cytotoxicity triggering receptor 3 ligand 1-like [Dendropsophus ebraccatus]|uniref:natural cytotoxicity triggering receptor 3 ligand 1-like n=1 Tax=Dendropsophus ebraccatus TaxID=150705 RepID=UPI003831FBBF
MGRIFMDHNEGRGRKRKLRMEMTLYQSLLIPLVILCSLLSHHCTHGILEIGSIDSPIEVSPGHNTTLPCLFYGYETPLDLSTVSVRWTLRTSEGDKQVYWFHGGDRIQTRPGSYIPDSGLIGGDGSLYISNIQPSDDEEYTCTVIVTPEKAIRKVTMEVSAVPTCAVSDSRLEIHPDTERSVTCYVSGFHPQPVTIRWVKYSKKSSKKALLGNQTCTSAPERDHDGTYNVKSLLTVRNTNTEEDGDVYSCVIAHRTLKDPLTCNVTLLVQTIHGRSTGSWIGILATLAVTLPIIAGLCGYIFKKVPPKDLAITKVKDLICCRDKTEVDSPSSTDPKITSQENSMAQTPPSLNSSADLHLEPITPDK